MGPAFPLSAGLRWETKEVERGPASGEPLEIPFHFTVEGDKPVRIQKVESDCSCTVAAPEKLEYAPGENGRIVATFTPGRREGIQEKHLAVQADDQKAPHRLVFRVKLPESVRVDLRQLVWQGDEAPLAKRIRLLAAQGFSLALKPLPEAQASRIRAELVPGGQTGESFLVITPIGEAGARAPALVPVTVHRFHDGQLVSPLTLFVRLQR